MTATGRPVLDRGPVLEVAAPEEGPNRLPRVQSAGGLTLLGLGGIIGVGIFVMAGIAARAAGPVLMVSFVLAAVACIATALCYAEFASRVPVAGSAYVYAYATLGEFPAWLMGWSLILCYTVAAASVASGWSHYFQSLLDTFGIHPPLALRTVPFDSDSAGRLVPSDSYVDVAAAVIPLVLALILFRGVRAGLLLNGAMVAVKVGVILFFCIVGAFYVDPANWHPFAPHGWGGIQATNGAGAAPGGPPPMGMLAGAALVFYAYLGFEAISAQSEDARRPQRDVSVGIVASILTCAALYVAVIAVLTGMVPYQQISPNAPLADAFRRHGLPWAHLLVATGALAGITTVLLVILLTLPRVLMAMGRDGLLPPGFFADIHPRFRTPAKPTLLAGGVVAVLGGLVPLKLLADLVTMGTLLGFVVVCASILLLRRRHSGSPPAFRAPLGPLTPLVAIGICLMLIISLPPINALGLLLWLLAGSVVYFAYGRRHSVLAGMPGPGSQRAPEPAPGLESRPVSLSES